MKEFICKENFYVEDVAFALRGDYIVLLPDNTTVVNKRTNSSISMPEIVNDSKYFTPTFELYKPTGDMVNHPPHYTWIKEKCGIEVIDITRHMDFCLGNAVKYILRSGRKEKASEIEDLKKAIWYISDKIDQLEKEK